MQVYLINLERFPERRRYSEDALVSLGIEHQIFRAVDGASGRHDLFDHYNEEKCLRYFGAPLRPGEIGCFASHYSLWQACVYRDVPIVVMEDDVHVHSEFAKALALASARIGKNRFIRLSGLTDRKYRTMEIIDENWRLVRFLRGPLGTQSYCLSPDGAAALLKAAEWWVEPVDLFIDRFWLHGVESVGLLPFEVSHDDRNSTIGGRSRQRSGLNKLRREFWRANDIAARVLHNVTHPIVN